MLSSLTYGGMLKGHVFDCFSMLWQDYSEHGSLYSMAMLLIEI